MRTPASLTGTAVQADVTVTFGTYKPGLLIDPGASHAGVTELVDIGLGGDLAAPDVVALQSEDVAEMLPRPSAGSDKYRRGVLGVLAGSDRFTGAAVLSVGGAVHGGAGMVRYLASSPGVAGLVRERWPEAVITVARPHGRCGRGGGCDQRGGPRSGLGRGAGHGHKRRRGSAARRGTGRRMYLSSWTPTGSPCSRQDRSLCAAPRQLCSRRTQGSWRGCCGVSREDVEARRLEHARRGAAELGATVLLKGSTTVIAGRGAPAWVNTMQTGWLATAGTGDVLSGLAGALIAQGLELPHAAAAAAYLHGLAGRISSSGAPIGAADVIGALPAAFRVVAANPQRPS